MNGSWAQRNGPKDKYRKSGGDGEGREEEEALEKGKEGFISGR